MCVWLVVWSYVCLLAELLNCLFGLLARRLVGWLVCAVGWLCCCLVVWLVGRLAGWSLGCLFVRWFVLFVRLLVCLSVCVIGLLVSRLMGWFVGGFGRLAARLFVWLVGYEFACALPGSFVCLCDWCARLSIGRLAGSFVC